MPGTILCATSLLPGQKIAARTPRRRQSEAARTLLDALGTGFAISATTMSHSRAAIAVAAGDGDSLALGIDIEWMRPDRPFQALTEFLLGPVPVPAGPEEFYRVWTFYEAYFKAFQRVPTESDLRTAMDTTNGTVALRLSDDTRLLQFRVAGEFQLSLVWRAPADYTVRYVPDRFEIAC
jgi:hypothetical protein